MTLTLAQLVQYTDTYAGIRSVTPLEPLGGPHDKVFPPTYAVGDQALTKYAVEERVVVDPNSGETKVVESTVLNSVPASAHQSKWALRQAWENGELDIPLIGPDFDAVDLPEYGLLTDLDCPHGPYDAILRDSLDGEVPFRHGEVGEAITLASRRSAAALFTHSPAALLFGGWDSTGPRGGLGEKFERAITTEIVAHGIAQGVKTSSRIDPLGIQRDAAEIFRTKDGGWDLDKANAAPKTKPLRPSEINHGNVAPSIDSKAGGITAESIVATTVISLVQLRRLQFPTDASGNAFDEDQRKQVAAAARTVLAALGLAATTLVFEGGFDLRSRCVLAPTADLTFEAVGRTGNVDSFQLTGAEALALVAEASEACSKAGLPWRSGVHRLRPTDRLATLVKKSREASEAVAAQED